MMLIRSFFYCGRAIRATSVASSYPSRKKNNTIRSLRGTKQFYYKIVAQFYNFQARRNLRSNSLKKIQSLSSY